MLNQLRAILLERGVIVPQGRARLRLRVTELLRQSTEQLSSRIRLLIEDMLAAWQALDERIAAFDAEFAAEAKRNESARRLTSIPGNGALNATTLVAAVGDAQTFARGRDLAAWLGLVPRQATTGGKPRLLGITKRGSKYLRKMLIQGARAALPTLSRGNTWLLNGCVVSPREPIRIRLSLPLPPRWRALSGHSCATAPLSNRK